MNIQHLTFKFKPPTLDPLPGALRWELNVESSALNVSSLLLGKGARNPKVCFKNVDEMAQVEDWWFRSRCDWSAPQRALKRVACLSAFERSPRLTLRSTTAMAAARPLPPTRRASYRMVLKKRPNKKTL
jgi:hypothetical protein